MRQVELNLPESLLEFLSHHRQYGFKDKSAMVQAALLTCSAISSGANCTNRQHCMLRYMPKTTTCGS